jgi:hypothetical protein
MAACLTTAIEPRQPLPATSHAQQQLERLAAAGVITGYAVITVSGCSVCSWPPSFAFETR